MRIEHALHHRTVLCLGLGLALLGHVPIAHAVNKNGLSTFGQKATVNSIQIGPVQKNSTWPTTASVDMSRPGGVGTPIGNSGWYVGPTPGPASGTTMNMGHLGDVYFSGTKYPFQASYKVTGGEFFAAASTLFKATPATLVASFLLPGFIDWLTLNDIKENPDKSDPNKPFLIKQLNGDFICQGSAWTGVPALGSTSNLGCGEFPAGTVTLFSEAAQTASCSVVNTCHPSVNYGSVPKVRTWGEGGLPASLDDIAPYMQKRPEPNIVSDLFDKGMDLPLGTPTVTGPATTPGTSETKTESKSDGSTVTTTTTTTNNYKTEGDTITKTNTTTNTVVNTCNAQGACTTETSSNVTVKPDSPDKPEEDQCKKNPDSLACAEADTPEEEIPKATKELTYSEDTMFSGGGSCPADKVMTLHTGQTVKVWDWQQGCSWIVTYVRPILLVVASYIAVMMLVPKT